MTKLGDKNITMSLECFPLLCAKIPSKMHSRTRMHLFLLPAWFKGPFFSFWHNQLGYSRNVQKSNKNRFFPIGTFHENFPIISSRNFFHWRSILTSLDICTKVNPSFIEVLAFLFVLLWQNILDIWLNMFTKIKC